MPNTSITQSQKRFLESVGALFRPDQRPTCLFLKSSSDVGVIRNGGRNGARFAPRSFLSTFKKFSQSPFVREEIFLEREVSDFETEKKNFSEGQKIEEQNIASLIGLHSEARICHLGGGHDHIYPLLKALAHKKKKVIVLNIDAHADTRTDETPHSGTPFRQFAREFQGEFHLFQIGLNSFANSFSTLSELEKGKQQILWKKDLNEENLLSFFKPISSLIDDSTQVVFSLDADAMKGESVPGVSAVNPDGLSMAELEMIWRSYRKLPFSHHPVLGIYELNPLYDSLASLSMRTLAGFLFKTWE